MSKGSPKAENGLDLLLGLMDIGMNIFFLTSYKFTDLRSVAQWLALTPRQFVKDTLPDSTLDNLPRGRRI
jgi:hypothetical protein